MTHEAASGGGTAPAPALCRVQRRALRINAAALAGVLAGAALLTLWLRQPIWVLIWVGGGLAISHGLLAQALRRRSGEVCRWEALTRALQERLDAQSAAIAETERDLAGLQAALADLPGLQRARDVLREHTTPQLSALVEDLTRTEDSLPETLPQTRAWVADVRRLAARARASVEAMSRPQH